MPEEYSWYDVCWRHEPRSIFPPLNAFPDTRIPVLGILDATQGAQYSSSWASLPYSFVCYGVSVRLLRSYYTVTSPDWLPYLNIYLADYLFFYRLHGNSIGICSYFAKLSTTRKYREERRHITYILLFAFLLRSLCVRDIYRLAWIFYLSCYIAIYGK